MPTTTCTATGRTPLALVVAHPPISSSSTQVGLRLRNIGLSLALTQFHLEGLEQ